ncbi:MAG: lysoplasmalogenase [Acidobacteria bacterium]|nr:lysoplasmalogenase [Acidobacteriota bacterium]
MSAHSGLKWHTWVWAVALVVAAAYLMAMQRLSAEVLAGLKPVPVLCLALVSARQVNGFWITVGLVLSGFGDVFLAVGDAYFIHGLSSFLLAHIAYIISFGWRPKSSEAWWLAPFVIWGSIMAWLLLPNTGSLTGPVMSYLVVIMFMMWRAVSFWRCGGRMEAAWGALIFGISDSLLACRLFLDAAWASPFWVMFTYWCAQVLIGRSSHDSHLPSR